MRRKAALILVLLFLSVFTAYAENLYKYNDWLMPRGREGKLLFLLQTAFYFIEFTCMSFFVSHLNRKGLGKKQQNHIKEIKNRALRRWLFLIAVYMIYLICFYPGVYGWDTANQIRDFFTWDKPYEIGWVRGQPKVSAWMNDHHPVLDTIVFSFFYWVGTLSGKVNNGLALYCICQIMLTAAVFVHALEMMDKGSAPEWFQRIAMAFYCMPFIAIYTVTMIKDSLFSIVFIEYLITYMSLSQKEICNKRLFQLGLYTLLCSLTKKTGIYICTAANVFLLLNKGVRMRKIQWSMATFFPALFVFVIMGHYLFPALRIYPGGKQEAFGMLFQQTARVVTTHSESISQDERNAIDRVLEYDKLNKQYNPRKTDDVKDHFRFNSDKKDLIGYLHTWFKLCKKYPGSAVNAVFAVNGGYFAPVQKMTVYTSVVELLDVWPTFRNPEALAPARNTATVIFEWLSNLPGLDLLFTLVVYTWWIPLLSAYCLIKQKDWNGILALTPIALSILVLLISPLCQLRYALPQVYAVPLVLGCGFGYGRQWV